MSSNIEKELDFADYDKDEPEESKAAAEAAVNAAASKVVKKVDADDYDKIVAENNKIVAENKKLKEELAVKSAKKTRAPKGLYKTQCNAVTKKIAPTIKYIKDNHNVHLECYMLGLYLKDITDALPESNDHEAFKRWLSDNKEFYGLKKQTRKSDVGATNVSFALGDLTLEQDTIDDDDDEEAGAA
jgi:hypothetical protein